MNIKWEFYKNEENKWRWKRSTTNGINVGVTAEGYLSYMNKADCERNARLNGWDGDLLFRKSDSKMTQKDLCEEKRAIKNMAYNLYRKHGFKNGNDFVNWLEAEKQTGINFRTKRNKQMKYILSTTMGIFYISVIILLMMLFKKNPVVELSEQKLMMLFKKNPVVKLSEQKLSAPKVMMFVLDPKDHEKVVVFGDTHFDHDKSILSQEAKILLDKNVQDLIENPKIEVRMAGYTFAEGTEEINEKLSEKRANTVRDYLIEKGITPERITVIGYGKTRPAVYEVISGDVNSKEAKVNMRVLFEVVVT